MASSITLPFTAAAIPCALPTNAEIEESSDVISAFTERRLVRVGKHFVVKYGRGIAIIEGENMLFVQKMTKINVPKVYALYTEPTTKKNYIVMENVEGDTLASKWPDLTEAQKTAIVANLKCFLEELRVLLPSPGYFGSLGRRGLLDEIFSTRDVEPLINGPFRSTYSLNTAMALKYVYGDNGLSPYKAEFYRWVLPSVLRGHQLDQPTFTHGDWQRKNLIIKKVPPRDDVLDADHRFDEFKVTVLDWENAGWYPEYWEYACAFWSTIWDDDWGLFLHKMMQPYASEAVWLHTFRNELRS